MLTNPRITVPGMIVLGLGFFGAEFAFPLGQTAAPLYVGIIGATLWLRGRAPVLIAAAACTVLTILGHFVSSAPSYELELFAHIDVLNRLLAGVALWLVAGLCLLYKRTEEHTVRLATIVEASQDAIVSIDDHGKIASWNPGAQEITGYSAEEMCGRPMTHFIAPGRTDGEEIRARLNRGEHLSGFETSCVTRDGGEIPMSLSASAIRDHRGDVVASALIGRDIRRRKRIEKELITARHAAEAASTAKSQFLANMSHEIRTPMNGVFGMLDLALDTELKPGQRHFLERAKSSADLLLRVIDDILDFSKIEAGRLELEPAEFSIRETLAETVQAFGARAHAKGLELALHVRPDVPAHVIGDSLRLSQIVTNLVGNAIKFTDSGEVVVHVETSVTREDSMWLHFSVSDTGRGISPDKQRIIFDAFAQADSSTARRFGGTGLGLAISGRLAELMGGSLWLESEPGRGSTFHFTGRFEPSGETEPRAPRERADLEGMPVLVVDDNATNRAILEEMLVNWRMTPTVVDSGKAALAAMHEAAGAGKPFPLVLVDGMMPELDGFEVAKQIKHDPELASAAILMLSSADQAGDPERCRELGIAAYLRKPIRQPLLLDSILAALGKLEHEPGADVALEPAEVRPGLRILLAEDNEVNQEFAVGLLTKHGHEVVVAKNGRDALRALDDERFDLVLMDVQMPDMDGFEATAERRRRESGTAVRVPIVAVTAHAMKGDRERCLAAGMDGYVSKPIRRHDLLRIMAELLPERRKAPRDGAAPVPATAAADESFDRRLALEYVEGDEEMLQHMIGIYLKTSPEVMERIAGAIGRGDSEALNMSAHRLKGSMSMFGARAASEAALTLEKMGENGDLTGAVEVHHVLRREAERLKTALAEFNASLQS